MSGVAGRRKTVSFDMMRESVTGKRAQKKRFEGDKGISHMERVLQAEGLIGAKALRQLYGCHV